MAIQITVYKALELLKGVYNGDEESIVTDDGRKLVSDQDGPVYIGFIDGPDEYHPTFVGYDAVSMERITIAPFKGFLSTMDMHLALMLQRVMTSCNKYRTRDTVSYNRLLSKERRPIIITADALEPILQELIADTSASPYNPDNQFLQSVICLFRFAIDEGYFVYIS